MEHTIGVSVALLIIGAVFIIMHNEAAKVGESNDSTKLLARIGLGLIVAGTATVIFVCGAMMGPYIPWGG